MKIIKFLQEAPAIMVFFLCLFGGGVASSSFSVVTSICREIKAVFDDTETQWMAVVCLGAYLVMFTAMNNRRLKRRLMPAGEIDLWKPGFLIISMLFYFLNYQYASQFTRAVILFGGAAVGSGVWVSLFWRHDPGPNMRSVWRFVTLVIFMLVIANFWNFGDRSSFSYKHNFRWVGPCDNPNLFGLLMASGAALAVGLSVSDAGPAGAPGWRWKFLKCSKSALFLAAAVVMGFGLWKSYSRGAWLAVTVGGVYVLIRRCILCHIESADQIRWMRAGAGIVIVLYSLLTLLFWQYQHTESLTVRRAISASNRNDLSWRNRISAWEGALQMMAERPIFGCLWNQPEALYEHYYLSPKLDESAAILMNDYLMLGATLGIPALFCFCMYLRLIFGRFKVQCSEFNVEETDTRELDWLKAVCRAGALVLAVGFWFDGGLFKLPTAATFWIFLELGRVD